MKYIKNKRPADEPEAEYIYKSHKKIKVIKAPEEVEEPEEPEVENKKRYSAS